MSTDTTLIDALDEQIALTEKEILCAEEVIRRRIAFLPNLRAKRNSFLPVFRLPPETLAIIFIHGAWDYYESEDGGRFTPRTPTWVNISYVCSHWRNIALNCPIRWTHHFTKSLRWTEELLLRSKEASLKLSCTRSYGEDGEFPRWPSLVDNLLKHSERIQELCLDVPLSFLPPTLTLCAPRLEKLVLDGIPMESIAIIDGDKFPLHTLQLYSCSLPWYSLNLSGLKTLVLCDVDSPSPLNMVEVLAVLSRMQNLTVLHLEHVLPSARHFLSSSGLDVSPKINLPLLAEFGVIEPLSTVVALLSCVNIPLRTQLHLEPEFEPGSTVGDFVPIPSFLAQQFSQQSSGLIFRSLSFNTSYSLTCGLEYEPPSLFKAVGRNIPLKITLGEVEEEDMELTKSDIPHMMSDICSSLPSRNIQSLHVSWPPLLFDFWREVLGCLDGLRYMKLSNGDMPDLSLLSLPACKSEESRGGQPSASSHMFVPVLEELELYYISFAPDDTSSSEGGMSQKSLFDTLSTRKGLRDRLTMTECNFTWDG